MKHGKTKNMKRIFLLSIFITLISFVNVNSQTAQNPAINEVTRSDNSNEELKGFVLDLKNHTALPYANIYALHKNKGTVSNEKGHFAINISGLDETDTLRFQYIGYKTRNLTINELGKSSVVYLKEDIINLSEILIFGSEPDPVAIVKKVLENKDLNYKNTTTKNQIFIRERSTADIETSIKFKKSSFPQLDEDITKLAEKSVPEHTTSYTDFLGYLYFSENQDDSLTLKIDPIRAVSLKEKDIAELEQLETVFEDLFADTGEKEYWKIKSGVFGQKIDIDEENEEPEKDTLNGQDTLKNNNKMLRYYRRSIARQLKYSLLDDDKEWEFLHKTGRYKYTIAGGTRVNGEDVYIIDFMPKNSGKYIGRVFISTNTYALIRADYEYAPGKTGRDFHLLGIGYIENQFDGSIYFEKKDSIYCLKYFSKKEGSHVSIDRNVSLLKKRKRFLFNKKLNEIKVGVIFAVNSEESIEYLVLDDKEIPHKQFVDFEQKDHLEMIYVDQFDDKLWKGYAIIEPTQQMREYRKQEADILEQK
ncbi:MAG: hypothetical protein B6I19_01900 [Bacteroidetes bacterium 4572_114]|nr:MAG: hypothetical protein B6I19_01900 [Bacteroidetes bacterium 4572_114]